MTTFENDKPTHELRWRRERFVRIAEGGGCEPYYRDTLQQKWKVAKGMGGRVDYVEEWRDVPVEVEDGDDV